MPALTTEWWRLSWKTQLRRLCMWFSLQWLRGQAVLTYHNIKHTADLQIMQQQRRKTTCAPTATPGSRIPSGQCPLTSPLNLAGWDQILPVTPVTGYKPLTGPLFPLLSYLLARTMLTCRATLSLGPQMATWNTMAQKAGLSRGIKLTSLPTLSVNLGLNRSFHKQGE